MPVKKLRPPTPIANQARITRNLQQPGPGAPSYEEMKARLAELEKQAAPKELSFKVSEKGGCSVYGLGRFPVTLYYEQWMRLLDRADDLHKFLAANKKQFKLKDGGAK